MPKPAPIPLETRRRVAAHIAMGHGRNATARHFQISPGMVTKIAREFGIYFPGAEMTDAATAARQIDHAAARLMKAEQIEAALNRVELKRALTGRDTPTVKEKRLSYALYNVDRHHDRRPELRPELERRLYR